MPRLVAVLLSSYRVLRLLLNAGVQLAVLLLALGLVRSARERFMVYAIQIAWLLRGCPEQWGLPDKCPARTT
jgi:hypothetical protein